MQLIGGLTVGAARVTAPCQEWPMVLYRMGVFSHGSVSLYLHTAPPSKGREQQQHHEGAGGDLQEVESETIDVGRSRQREF
ncbi:hypothetical protein BJX66DRAFT_291762, partial [Aspergillus keveii]